MKLTKEESIEKVNQWHKDNPERSKQAGKERLKLWRKENPDKVKEQQKRRKEKKKVYDRNRRNIVRDQQLKSAYGLSLQEYDRILQEQNHKCKICKCDKCPSGKSFAVDHCHQTNKIRGLLCKNCNIGLGMFNDNLELLLSAYQYIKGASI